MTKPGEQTGKPTCKICGKVIFELTTPAGVWRHADWVKMPDHDAAPSAAPVVTDLAQRIRDILAEDKSPHDGNPTSYICWLQGKLMKIHKEVMP